MNRRKETQTKKVDEVSQSLTARFGGDEDNCSQVMEKLDPGELSSVERTVNEGVPGKEEKWWSKFLRMYVTGST